MKTAIVTGISGQDGAYLSKLLLNKGYKVIGAERRNASGQLWRLEKLKIFQDIEFDDFELTEFSDNLTKGVSFLRCIVFIGISSSSSKLAR